MEKIFLITLLISILALSNSATKEKVEDLFNGLYSGEVYSGYLQTTIQGDELFYLIIELIFLSLSHFLFAIEAKRKIWNI